MKPKLKPPGTNCLKLKCDILLSNAAFKFNLRRYSMGHTVLSLVGGLSLPRLATFPLHCIPSSMTKCVKPLRHLATSST